MSGKVIKLFESSEQEYSQTIKAIREINKYRGNYVGVISNLQKNLRTLVNVEAKTDIENTIINLKNIVRIFDNNKKLLEIKAKELEPLNYPISHSSNQLNDWGIK